MYLRKMVKETIASVEADEDYAEYDFQQKLLAFYFTFFSHIQSQRSRFVKVFPVRGRKMIKGLHGMRKEFIEYAEGLLHQGMDEGVVVDRKGINQLYSKGMFEQFRSIMLFHRCDDSEKFQDTDAFIEKSVKVLMDGLGSSMVDSIIDLARFMVRKTPLGR